MKSISMPYYSIKQASKMVSVDNIGQESVNTHLLNLHL
jgi:hypothetical protein